MVKNDNGEKKPAAFVSDAERDAEIARFESMSSDEVDAELLRLEINPDPTIEAVKRLVQEKLAQWHAADHPSTNKN